MSRLNIIDIDFESNVAFSDEGHMLQIESYVDSEETPCLPEEACAIYVMISNTAFQKVELLGENDDFDSYH